MCRTKELIDYYHTESNTREDMPKGAADLMIVIDCQSNFDWEPYDQDRCVDEFIKKGMCHFAASQAINSVIDIKLDQLKVLHCWQRRASKQGERVEASAA